MFEGFDRRAVPGQGDVWSGLPVLDGNNLGLDRPSGGFAGADVAVGFSLFPGDGPGRANAGLNTAGRTPA
jgi:hypothetical protein